MASCHPGEEGWVECLPREGEQGQREGNESVLIRYEDDSTMPQTTNAKNELVSSGEITSPTKQGTRVEPLGDL